MSTVSTGSISRASAALTVRDVTFDLLRRFKMTKIFANPGSTELPLFLNLPDDFEYILGLQESTVVGMADGYAQATHNAAFINLHSAAGVGHAMGNIFTAFKNRTPLVITAGQQARPIMPFDPFLYSAQATELARPYVKWSIEPARAEDVPLAIARAYYTAMQEPRGPVLVSIPVDDWEKNATPLPERHVGQVLRADYDSIKLISTALNTCKRPAFVLGGAVDRAHAWEKMCLLAEHHHARVYTAPMTGRSTFPENHPLFAGFLPAMREKIVATLADHDAIFVFGAPAITYHVDGNGPHVPPGSKLYHVTDDPAAIAWAYEGTAAIGNILSLVTELLELASPVTRTMPAPRSVPPNARETTPLSAAFVLQTLAQMRDPHSIIVEEAPSTRSIIQAYLPIMHSHTFYTMDSGGLGYAMPASVGIALACPTQRIITVIGDGSSLYSIQALWTAAQWKLPITYLILNNGRYAALQDFAPAFGFKSNSPVPGTELPNIDFIALATSFGCKGYHANDAESFHKALTTALSTPTPTVVDVTIS